MKIIETNISLDKLGKNFVDFQSRVIEIKDWNDYVNEVKTAKVVMRNSAIGSLHGASVPKNAKIKEFKYDDRHLSCTIENGFVNTRKLAYLI